MMNCTILSIMPNKQYDNNLGNVAILNKPTMHYKQNVFFYVKRTGQYLYKKHEDMFRW